MVGYFQMVRSAGSRNDFCNKARIYRVFISPSKYRLSLYAGAKWAWAVDWFLGYCFMSQLWVATCHLLSSRFLSRSQNCRKRLLDSSCLRVSPSTLRKFASHWKGFIKFDIWTIFDNPSRKFKFYPNVTKIKSTLHEDLCTFMMYYNLSRMYCC